MYWISYIEIQGLYAEAAREAKLVSQDQTVAVMRDGTVYDGCRKAFTSGLRLGTPSRQVLRDAPGAVQVELAQVNAGGRARAWWEICLRQTPYIEPAAPHQVYLALPFPDTSELPVSTELLHLQQAAVSFGFTAFAGVGSTKLVARAAALGAKARWLSGTADDTVQIVLPGTEERFLATLPISYLPADREGMRRLARLGIRTIGEAARVSEQQLLRQLGPTGRRIFSWCRGRDNDSVKCMYPPRVLERYVQFQTVVSERSLLERLLCREATMLSRQLQSKGEGCQQVALVLGGNGGAAVRRERILAKLQQNGYPLRQALQALLDEALREPGLTVESLGIELGLIGPMPWRQLDLWDDRGRMERDERLQQALSLLHERFPVRIVSLGTIRDVSWREQMLQYCDPFRWQAAQP